MKKIIVFLAFVLTLSTLAFAPSANAASTSERLSGRILLQVEANGEAWFVNPDDKQRYYLGRPYDAWNIMRSLGLGISNADLAKIPTDSDSWDGEQSLINRLKGKILLQTEKNGEGWYLSPVNGKRYYLGKPSDAFGVMRNLGLGITNRDLFSIPSNIQIVRINYNGTGRTEPDEYIEIKNTGKLAQTFNTWTLADGDGHVFTFPNDFTLKPSEVTRVYTNQGELSFKSNTAIWNNSGDSIELRGANGALISAYSYISTLFFIVK
ncbi:lamin tail domain-containing protein [Patescibacteria group bacterium]|nr:lamin tail domain-containing protein [Patescibacteria group bacterium]